MNPIVITSPTLVEDFQMEIDTIVQLFDAGLSYLHIRKITDDVELYDKFVSKLVVLCDARLLTIHHNESLARKYQLGGLHISYSAVESLVVDNRFRYSVSCHSAQELSVVDKLNFAEYQFISPIFDSISKEGYCARFSRSDMKKFILDTPNTPAVALGGVDQSGIPMLKDIGFYSAALLGAVWNRQNGVNHYKSILKAWQE